MNKQVEKINETGVGKRKMNEKTLIDALTIGLGGIYGYLTELDYGALFILMILMLCDILVGVLFAMYNGNFRSYNMRKGLISKLLFLILLLALTMFQLVLREYEIMPPFANVMAGVFGCMEIMSILETFAKNGVVVPGCVVKWFDEKYKEVNGNMD